MSGGDVFHGQMLTAERGWLAGAGAHAERDALDCSDDDDRDPEGDAG
jgi:hypothetical protein